MYVAYEQPNIKPRKKLYQHSQQDQTSWMAF